MIWVKKELDRLTLIDSVKGGKEQQGGTSNGLKISGKKRD